MMMIICRASHHIKCIYDGIPMTKDIIDKQMKNLVSQRDAIIHESIECTTYDDMIHLQLTHKQEIQKAYVFFDDIYTLPKRWPCV